MKRLENIRFLTSEYRRLSLMRQDRPCGNRQDFKMVARKRKKKQKS